MDIYVLLGKTITTDLCGAEAVRMAEEKVTQNREDILRIEGHLKLVNQKLDNHVNHISGKIDTIFKIVWTVSFMLLGLIVKAVYTGLIG